MTTHKTSQFGVDARRFLTKPDPAITVTAISTPAVIIRAGEKLLKERKQAQHKREAVIDANTPNRRFRWLTHVIV